ncbi:hypothetical protein V5O48_014501 [Marasmius crinis-equi]|uniref:Uncharacterized protein n=1 Tax=Marasmius crinis-equi TaxID=585013 RepID=A0ABR3EX45_9AGAR
MTTSRTRAPPLTALHSFNLVERPPPIFLSSYHQHGTPPNVGYFKWTQQRRPNRTRSPHRKLLYKDIGEAFGIYLLVLPPFTVGFGIGAGLCSIVAGSVGLYDQVHKQSPRNKNELQANPDPERGGDSIPLVSLRLPSTLGNGTFGDAEVSTGITTGIEQRSLRSRRSPQRTVPSSKPYTATRPSGSSTKRRRPKPLQTSVAHFKDMKETANTTNLRNLNLLPELALEMVQIAKEASALAQATTDICKEQFDRPSLQSDIDTFVRALQEVRNFAAARNMLKSSPAVDIDRLVLQAYRETLITAQRQLTASGSQASEVEEITSRPRATSSAGSDGKDSNGPFKMMFKDDTNDEGLELDQPQGELPPTMVLSMPFNYGEEGDADSLTRNGSVQGLDNSTPNSPVSETSDPTWWQSLPSPVMYICLLPENSYDSRLSSEDSSSIYSIGAETRPRSIHHIDPALTFYSYLARSLFEVYHSQKHLVH